MCAREYLKLKHALACLWIEYTFLTFSGAVGLVFLLLFPYKAVF